MGIVECVYYHIPHCPENIFPEACNALNTGTVCGHDVDLPVPEGNHMPLLDSQLVQCLVHLVRSWLDILAIVLADKTYMRDSEMPTDLFHIWPWCAADDNCSDLQPGDDLKNFLQTIVQRERGDLRIDIIPLSGLPEWRG